MRDGEMSRMTIDMCFKRVVSGLYSFTLRAVYHDAKLRPSVFSNRLCWICFLGFGRRRRSVSIGAVDVPRSTDSDKSWDGSAA